VSAPKKVPITLVSFVDQRSDKKVVGTVRNGFGMRTADVIPTNSVADWVTQALKTELQNNGYTVESATARDKVDGSSTIISGEFLKVFCDVYFNYTGEVSLVAAVSQDGKEVLRKNYSGEGSAGASFAATEKSYAQSLSLALSAALKQFVSDLDKTLSAPKI
jgi:hypothetical protein